MRREEGNPMTWTVFLKMLRQMAEASVGTLTLFFLTLLLALPLGLLVAQGRMSRHKWISWPVRAYLLIMRGTPLMLQLIFFWFAPTTIFHNLDFSNPVIAFLFNNRMTAAVMAFTLNYAAYFSEIYRGGIESVSLGQREAADVLGFTRRQTFFHIVLPQVVKKILPPMSNEFMTLVKDTALASTIGVAELFILAREVTSAQATLLPVFVAGLFYLAMDAIVSKCFSVAEKKLAYYQ